MKNREQVKHNISLVYMDVRNSVFSLYFHIHINVYIWNLIIKDILIFDF